MAKELKIGIHSIHLTSLEIYRLTNIPTKAQKTHWDVQGKSSVVPQEKLIVIDTEVTLRTEERQMGKISAIVRFVSPNFESDVNKNSEGDYVIPKPLQDKLQLVCISILRGMMVSEFKGTVLNNAILPLMHVKVGEANNIY